MNESTLEHYHKKIEKQQKQMQRLKESEREKYLKLKEQYARELQSYQGWCNCYAFKLV